MRKKILIGIGVIILIGGAVAAYYANAIWSPNVRTDLEDYSLKIPTGASFEDAFELIKEKQLLKDTATFKLVCNLMSYGKTKVAPGLFEAEAGWSNRELITRLRSGIQKPVKLTLNNIRLIEELGGQVAKYIEPDSATLMQYILNETRLEEMGYNRDNILTLFIPNTYEFYWNTSPERYLQRMKKEHENYWSKGNRRKYIEELNLTDREAYTLASIVEKESIRDDEKPRIAGVYLNRLRKGMLLQADPTVVFAVKQFDLRRVLNKHLNYDSPFNTYKYTGLPPGPICMPSIASLEAVVNAERHDYIFFCAKPGFNSEHAFAKTLREHNNNANRYRTWLSQQSIR